MAKSNIITNLRYFRISSSVIDKQYEFVTNSGYMPLVKLKEELSGSSDTLNLIHNQLPRYNHEIESFGTLREISLFNGFRYIYDSMFIGLYNIMIIDDNATKILNSSLWNSERRKEWYIQSGIPSILMLGLIKISNLRNLKFTNSNDFEYNMSDITVLVNNNRTLGRPYTTSDSGEGVNSLLDSCIKFCDRHGVEVKYVEESEILKFVEPKTQFSIKSLSEQIEMERVIRDEFFSELNNNKVKELFFA